MSRQVLPPRGRVVKGASRGDATRRVLPSPPAGPTVGKGSGRGSARYLS